MVSVRNFCVAPTIFIPSCRHCTVVGGSPVAETEKVTLLPRRMFCDTGCCEITAGPLRVEAGVVNDTPVMRFVIETV